MQGQNARGETQLQEPNHLGAHGGKRKVKKANAATLKVRRGRYASKALSGVLDNRAFRGGASSPALTNTLLSWPKKDNLSQSAAATLRGMCFRRLLTQLGTEFQSPLNRNKDTERWLPLRP